MRSDQMRMRSELAAIAELSRDRSVAPGMAESSRDQPISQFEIDQTNQRPTESRNLQPQSDPDPELPPSYEASLLEPPTLPPSYAAVNDLM